MGTPAMDEPIPLLNVFEIQDEGRTRHLIGFLDTILAKSKGLASHAMVGEFDPLPDGSFDLKTFRLNPEFLAAFEGYMNLRARRVPELADSARERPGEPLYVIDPRNQRQDEEGPPLSDVLGHYSVDPAGGLVEDSFAYNPKHLWFCPESGISGLFFDREFYAILHPEYIGGALSIFQHDGNALPAEGE